MNKITVSVGGVRIGFDEPVVVQTMCNTHTSDVEATLAQCRRLAAAGAQLIRITCPGLQDVEALRTIHDRMRAEGISTPLVADIHFSSATAIAVAPYVEKVRINPGNFHKDHAQACQELGRLLDVCHAHGTAVRIGLNHGSLGERITRLYGNTPEAMARAAMEWLRLCMQHDFFNVVVSLKSSNTVVMVEAYRLLYKMMQAEGTLFPMHVGVTEAGGGDAGRIKSCVGIATLLAEGIGQTVRVSLTEDPEAEIPVARYLADRYSRGLRSSLTGFSLEGGRAVATYDAPSREKLLLDAACDWGPRLLDRRIDDVVFRGTCRDEDIVASGLGEYLADEILQAARRRFYRPEYVACPGCGRTMYDLQGALREVQARTADLKDVVIAVMGCIVNGPGEMADADWGYVGEGGGRVTLYKGREPVLRHVPEAEAPDRLLALIRANSNIPEE